MGKKSNDNDLSLGKEKGEEVLLILWVFGSRTKQENGLPTLWKVSSAQSQPNDSTVLTASQGLLCKSDFASCFRCSRVFWPSELCYHQQAPWTSLVMSPGFGTEIQRPGTGSDGVCAVLRYPAFRTRNTGRGCFALSSSFQPNTIFYLGELHMKEAASLLLQPVPLGISSVFSTLPWAKQLCGSLPPPRPTWISSYA